MCMCTNVRSIMNKNKRHEIEIIIREKGVDILGITESWGNEYIGDAELSFNGYDLFRQDRIMGDKGRGGGVLLYVREGLGAVREEQIGRNINESIWVRILDSVKREIYIGVCYKSPTASREEIESLYECINHYSKRKSLIMGDFNFKDINWVDMEAVGEGREFVTLINDCFRTQHVLKATRGANILNLVFTSEPCMVDEVLIENPIYNSDHNALLWEFKSRSTTEETLITEYSYNKGDYIKIGECLKGVA